VPYFVHVASEVPETGRTYTTIAEASQSKQSGETITFIESRDESFAWRNRESDRIVYGEYVKVPWHSDDSLPKIVDHYVHVSLKVPGLLAYTKSPQHGYEDRQTPIKPGRYLKTFYPDLTDERIAVLAAQCTAESVTLKYAITPDEIESVYTTPDSPRSCMDNRHRFRHGHPTRVYGNSDLQLAYVGTPGGKIAARAVVWPDEQKYYSTYGHQSLITRLLDKAGYRHGTFEGAKIRAIETSSGDYVMPYVDGIYTADLSSCGKWFTLGDGEYDTNNTGGYTTGSHCGHCDGAGGNYDGSGLCQHCYENTFTCDGCDNRTSDDECNPVDGSVYCDDCHSSRFFCCDECNETYDNDECNRTRDRQSLCNECHSNYARECQIDGCYNEWNDADEYTAREITARENDNTNDLCECCAREYRYVECCNDYVKIEDRCECEIEIADETARQIADAESDGFGVSSFDPAGTPWQIDLRFDGVAV